jgi:hypothetical protein
MDCKRSENGAAKRLIGGKSCESARPIYSTCTTETEWF